MIEINLLPWREAAYQHQTIQERRQLLLIFLLPMIVLFLQHGLLGLFVKREILSVAHLNKKLNAIQYHPFPLLEKNSHQYQQLIDSMEIKRKSFQQLLNDIGGMSAYHLRLIKINYLHDTIHLFGRTDSINELEQWESFILKKNYRVKIDDVRSLPGLDVFQFHAKIG